MVHARDKKAVILTEDKDFGELAFSFNIADCSIVLLRYRKPDYADVVKHLLQVLADYYNNPDQDARKDREILESACGELSP